LFLSTAALAFFAIPLWGNMLEFGTIFEILSGIVLVMLAGLTSPEGKVIMVFNILISALGAFMLELTAVSYQSSSSFMLLSVRETGAILLIIALYFSMKTMRAMMQGKIGDPYEADDFTPEVAADAYEYKEDDADMYEERDSELEEDASRESFIEVPHKKHLANPEMEYY
jgi:hypothetical protein